MPEIILGLIIGAVVFVVAFSISKLFASSPRAAIAGSLMVIAALIGFLAPAPWLLVLDPAPSADVQSLEGCMASEGP